MNKNNNIKNDINKKDFLEDIDNMIKKLNRHLLLKTNFEKVIDFHKKANILPTKKINKKLKELRIALLKEEFNEYLEAEQKGDIKNILKELADILYIVYGTSYCYNYDMNIIFDSVHKSNLTKFKGKKTIVDEKGKIMKNKEYVKADISLEDSKIL